MLRELAAEFVTSSRAAPRFRSSISIRQFLSGNSHLAIPIWQFLCSNETMKTANAIPTDLVSALEDIAREAITGSGLMTAIVALMHEKLQNYNWVGFYMLEKEAGKDLLVLGPFRGAATPHTRIPLHQGICGAAASRGETVIVDDVGADARYLACSVETKSEIVVPIFAKGKVVGELDIDSHVPAAFGGEDRRLCEHVAALVGAWLEQHAE
jgi:L-methionine (R)-S-oxide reductase